MMQQHLQRHLLTVQGGEVSNKNLCFANTALLKATKNKMAL